MSDWRVIITDTESMTGVAPVCRSEDHADSSENQVFDCCPHPQIETWNEHNARELAEILTDTDAETCS